MRTTHELLYHIQSTWRYINRPHDGKTQTGIALCDCHRSADQWRVLSRCVL